MIKVEGVSFKNDTLKKSKPIMFITIEARQIKNTNTSSSVDDGTHDDGTHEDGKFSTIQLKKDNKTSFLYSTYYYHSFYLYPVY